MTFPCLAEKYPDIADLFISPVFREPVTICEEGVSRRNNAWCNFWNLTGARAHKPSKYECVICGCPTRRRGKKYPVCHKHTALYRKYIRDGTMKEHCLASVWSGAYWWKKVSIYVRSARRFGLHTNQITKITLGVFTVNPKRHWCSENAKPPQLHNLPIMQQWNPCSPRRTSHE